MSDCKHGYGSPRWSGEICDCSLPMTMDTYSNCSFGCVYCFSQYQRGIGGGKDDYKAKNVRSVDVERVKRIFTGEQESQFWPFIQARKTIQWGGLSDQFDGYERMHGVTLEREVGYLTAHGVFGLLGYCSISSKPVDRMALRDKVEDIMDLLGLPASPDYVAAR